MLKPLTLTRIGTRMNLRPTAKLLESASSSREELKQTNSIIRTLGRLCRTAISVEFVYVIGCYPVDLYIVKNTVSVSLITNV